MQKLRPRASRLPKSSDDLSGIRDCGRQDFPHRRLAPLSCGVFAFGDEAFNIEHRTSPISVAHAVRGSPIAYRSECHPDLVDLFAGTLTDPTRLSPSLHTHADEQLPWFEMLDDLPRYAQGSRGQTPMRYGPREARK